MSFLASVAIAFAAIMAAGIAFFTACTISLFGGAAVGEIAGGASPGGQDLLQVVLMCGLGFCVIASLAAFIGMFWITWPAKRPSR
jgi:hypothetical protein